MSLFSYFAFLYSLSAWTQVCSSDVLCLWKLISPDSFFIPERGKMHLAPFTVGKIALFHNPFARSVRTL